MEILEYLMKFNTVSLHWHNLGFSIIIIFLKIISLHLNHLKFQLKADYQSHAITLVHPDTIIQKKKNLLLYNDSTWCSRAISTPHLLNFKC